MNSLTRPSRSTGRTRRSRWIQNGFEVAHYRAVPEGVSRPAGAHSAPGDKLRAYTAADIPDPLLRASLLEDNREAIIAARDPLVLPVAFDSIFTRQEAAFMLALTDDRARDLSRFTPNKVPSGLPVDR